MLSTALSAPPSQTSLVAGRAQTLSVCSTPTWFVQCTCSREDADTPAVKNPTPAATQWRSDLPTSTRLGYQWPERSLQAICNVPSRVAAAARSTCACCGLSTSTSLPCWASRMSCFARIVQLFLVAQNTFATRCSDTWYPRTRSQLHTECGASTGVTLNDVGYLELEAALEQKVVVTLVTSG